jgi:hypothetical protein
VQSAPTGSENARFSGWRRAAVAGVVVVVAGALGVGVFTLAVGSDATHSTFPIPAATTTPKSAGILPPTSSPTPTATQAPEPVVCADVNGASVMSDGMVMAPVPNRLPTAAERSAAQKLVESVTGGVARYAHLSAAVADGYVPATNPKGYIVHYANWGIVRDGDVLDANRPSSLVYANTVSGPLLIGVMFLGPAPCRPGPDVGGPLTEWHAHANLCLSATHQVVGRSDSNGECTVGAHNTNTYFMMHVWTAPTLAQSYQFAAHVPTAAYAAIIRSGRA